MKIEGIIRPVIKKQHPKNELFYGLPATKTIPKNKEDLIEKFKYVNNYEDMMDMFKNCEDFFSGNETAIFLDRLNR